MYMHFAVETVKKKGADQPALMCSYSAHLLMAYEKNHFILLHMLGRQKAMFKFLFNLTLVFYSV